ncbi:protein phosphatase 1 regulatory subunit 21 [Lucilia cuprina]|uniref:protein phosphatase 1 regulatory subunit 21 n=1 Tax=Lucilia cuprina TaxID=7375 RepID=UPI001F058A02|nr:protein phosphatase 1 regulatory subunit 21 [Lucilia cuprina]
MDGFVPEDKYQKLASEYAKLRAQASVLRKALLEEQAKSSTLRDQLKQKETTLRRAEQEIDSLGFRNKQLEHRVASLQDDLATSEARKKEKESKKRGNNDKIEAQQVNLMSGHKDDSLIFEELQKKIMENAELTSLIDDKERSLQMHSEHIKSMEQMIEKHNLEHADVEKRLRKEMETLQSRNQELETKLVEAASMLGSEDALSASGSDYTPYHNNNQIQHSSHQMMSSECRIANLEKEVAHWRSQFELSKLYTDTLHTKPTIEANAPMNASTSPGNLFNCSSTTSAAGLTSIPSVADGKSSRDSKTEQFIPTTKELLLFNNLGKKFEDLLKEKLLAESRLASFMTEVDHLQNCLENATQELKGKDEQLDSINQALHLLEEDLTTTRVNYDEQISVLTEQVISLSEQLAASK